MLHLQRRVQGRSSVHHPVETRQIWLSGLEQRVRLGLCGAAWVAVLLTDDYVWDRMVTRPMVTRPRHEPSSARENRKHQKHTVWRGSHNREIDGQKGYRPATDLKTREKTYKRPSLPFLSPVPPLELDQRITLSRITNSATIDEVEYDRKKLNEKVSGGLFSSPTNITEALRFMTIISQRIAKLGNRA